MAGSLARRASTHHRHLYMHVHIHVYRWLSSRMHADKGIDVRVYMRMDMHMVMCTQMEKSAYEHVYGHV